MRNTVWLLCLCTAHFWCESNTSSVATPKSGSIKNPTANPITTTTAVPTTPASPSNVNKVEVLNQTETELWLKWDKVNNNNSYDYKLRNNNGGEESSIISRSDTNKHVEYKVSSLSAGTNYSFTLFTVFEGVNSTGFPFSAVTAPSNVNKVEVLNQTETELWLKWDKVNNNNSYDYKLRNNNGGEESSIIDGSDALSYVEYKVSSLSAGTNYSFTLFTEFKGVNSTGFPFSAVTAPSNINKVEVLNQTETELWLKWDKVNNNNSYDYKLRNNNGGEESSIIDGSDALSYVEYKVLSLSAGTNYSFTLFTVFEGVNSTGFPFSAVTAPSDVTQVNVVTRSETHLQLKWTKVNNDNNYNYILKDSNGAEVDIAGSDAGTTVKHTVSSLSAGTEYTFTLLTVFEGVNSTGYNFLVVTTINCTASEWTVSHSTIEAEVQGVFTTATANNGSEVNGLVVGNKVSFSNLYPGATYSVSLYYELGQEKLSQCSHNLTFVTVPPLVQNLICNGRDYSLSLKWGEPDGVWTAVEVNVSGKSSNVSGTLELIVAGLQPANTYSISITTLSGATRGLTQLFSSCQTQSTVIWVPVLVIILLGLLAAMGVFMLRRKSQLLSKVHMPMYERHSDTGPSQDKFKAISVKKFPDHFYHLSRDENREFTGEYLQFSTVGADLSQHEAILPENKSKNRFIDILPYDYSRVKLSTRGQNSDYINANFIPGYRDKKMEYIATQGPLTSTVSDFWRMIWEQKSERIVMVTNCIENGKAKCDQYWPQDPSPCRHGDLLITMTSERKDTDWIVRELIVKNEAKSEERRVKHFHFTAWPDHGVPNGTQELIEFRGLIRQHIHSSRSSGPTVVHCSAGVGRTGTLIALDVLLQQMEREQAVDIAGFVHRMRRHRPRMVQTESQYIFLHQCIKDCLPQEKPEEPIYVNTASPAIIYENTAAITSNYRN
ncbi:receptor-type tyrosine-protein phosphatase H isoform X1 [Alosa sapidissima]|uniref:receptor-type tyrosine-protein phosphatase H isoform X1 n=1 Tax=Alosa sapidissima TaxID=34773 RepID=UPI001C08ECAF|nr:receptor-type tyrosine-protein phosphatase H isoform X1 [Alosa sapidissima]